MNQTKIKAKGGCRSGKKVVPHDSKSDLPLGRLRSKMRLLAMDWYQIHHFHPLCVLMYVDTLSNRCHQNKVTKVTRLSISSSKLLFTLKSGWKYSWMPNTHIHSEGFQYLVPLKSSFPFFTPFYSQKGVKNGQQLFIGTKYWKPSFIKVSHSLWYSDNRSVCLFNKSI